MIKQGLNFREVNQQLQDLFDKHKQLLMAELFGNIIDVYRVKKLDAAQINVAIDNILEIKQQDFVKQAKFLIKELATKRAILKFHGFENISDLKRLFVVWYRKKFNYHNHLVYVFRDDMGTVIYVGQSINGFSRPLNHFSQAWFTKSSITSVEILIPQKPKSLSELECAAIHLYLPTRNLKKSPNKKYNSSCKICFQQWYTKKEIKRMFPLLGGSNKRLSSLVKAS